MSEARLTRSDNDKMIAGICGGLAAYIGIDSALVRALFFFLVLASGIGIPIYLILWFIMPGEGNMHQPNAEIIQNNIEEMGQTITKSINRIGRPGTLGSILILFGFYFLLNKLGFLHWLNGGIFWPLLIVALGIYMLIRQR